MSAPMIMLLALSIFEILLSPGIIPLVLTGIAAFIEFRYDTKTDNIKNKRRRAWWTFIVTGVAGTIVSIVLFAREQADAKNSEQKAAEFGEKLDQATNQLGLITEENQALKSQIADIQAALDKDMDQLLALLSKNPPSVVNNNYSSTITSNNLVSLQTIVLAINKVGDTKVQATNTMLQAKIENAHVLLRLRSQALTNAMFLPEPVENKHRLAPPTGLRAVPAVPSP